MSNCKTNLQNISSVERDPVFLSQKAKPGGVATLDANGKVPLSQIDLTAIFTEHDPVYEADRGQPFGCPTLDGSARVLRNQLGSGTANSTTFLRGDGTWAPGGGGGDSFWKQTGNDISLVTPSNRVVVGDVPSIAKFGVKGDTPTDITAIIRAAAGQTADVLEVQNSAGTILAAITAAGALLVRAATVIGSEIFRVSAGDALLDFTSLTALKVTQTGGGAPTLIVDTTNTRVGIGAPPSFMLDVAGDGRIAGPLGVGIAPSTFMLDVLGDTRITGKLTVTGAIDPTSVLLSGGTALYYESNDGSTAPVSGVATGRLRYNDLLGVWQKSTQGGPYIDMVSGSGNAFRMVKWISTAETADGPVESDTANTFLAPNVDNFLPLGTSSARFLSVSASDVLGVFLSQGDAEYASELRFDRLAFGIGGSTNPPDVSLRRSAVNTVAISDNTATGGGDITLSAVADALFIDSENGSNAPVSGPNTGRLRYNDTYGYWEQSTLGNPYVPVGDVRDIFRYSMLHNLA